MSLICWCLNSIISLSYRQEYKKFLNIKDSLKVQENILFKTLNDNKDTMYGKKYSFANIKNIKQFQKLVPLSNYEDYIPYIKKIKEGEKNVITQENIKLLELTSGSTSASKEIPYTEKLKKQFLCGIKPWIYDIYKKYPKVKSGRSYWSISPVIGEKKFTKSGIPIGFEDDSEYIGNFEKYFFNKVFAVPKDIAHCKSVDEFYIRTSISLLRCKNLSLISIWNPTFFMLIIDYIKNHYDSISKHLTKSRKIEVKNNIINGQFDKIWPNLELISCWGDANSEIYYSTLSKMFPKVKFQPKGLISTEGFISFPLAGIEGSFISVNSHFFEFIDTESGDIKLISDINIGKQYEVVITTAGGLYRYKTGDIIEIINKKNQIPIIKFLGRKNNVSDLFGEKLNTTFLKNVISKLNINAEFYMFAPKSNGYVLYIKTNKPIPDIDKELCDNFHYDYCRKLGQLKKLKVFKLEGNPINEYIDFCIKKGQKIGDIKLPILSKFEKWDEIFKGRYE